MPISQGRMSIAVTDTITVPKSMLTKPLRSIILMQSITTIPAILMMPVRGSLT
jgi:hypothetical protein